MDNLFHEDSKQNLLINWGCNEVLWQNLSLNVQEVFQHCLEFTRLLGNNICDRCLEEFFDHLLERSQ